MKNKYALLSVFDKTGIVDLARFLKSRGYEIISTGKTAQKLKENGIKVIPVEKITGNPECLGGRMKTISFQIEAGILYDRTNITHLKEARQLGIKPIDIVVCNFYPFEEITENKSTTLETAIENIDVGGPTMVRAAAKNFKNVLVIIDPDDYPKVISAIKKREVSITLRREFAAKAFAAVSFYDSQIAKFLEKEKFPEKLILAGRKKLTLRYGENPHQNACFYLQPNVSTPLKNLQRLWGRELSLINLTDINAGLEVVRLFYQPCAVIIKHNSPCGIALGDCVAQALKRAIAADPVSAFGGVIVLNKEMDLKTAQIIGSFKKIQKSNIDIIAAPKISQAAFRFLQQVRKNMGIYLFGQMSKDKQRINVKWVDGGFIVQTANDNIEEEFKDWKVVTENQPTRQQLKQAEIGWMFISRIRSNSVIVIDKKIPMTRGIGSGQTSRIAATKIALEQAGKYTKGGILVSDSFFPFDDSIKLAAKHGIGFIVQQGGSINDEASIKAANKAKIPMVFTNYRAFWH